MNLPKATVRWTSSLRPGFADKFGQIVKNRLPLSHPDRSHRWAKSTRHRLSVIRIHGRRQKLRLSTSEESPASTRRLRSRMRKVMDRSRTGTNGSRSRSFPRPNSKLSCHRRPRDEAVEQTRGDGMALVVEATVLTRPTPRRRMTARPGPWGLRQHPNRLVSKIAAANLMETVDRDIRRCRIAAVAPSAVKVRRQTSANPRHQPAKNGQWPTAATPLLSHSNRMETSVRAAQKEVLDRRHDMKAPLQATALTAMPG